MQIIERKFQNMLKEIFTGVPKYSILHKERKKTNKPNIPHWSSSTVNFVLMKHN